MDINFSKIFLEWLVKIPQYAPKWLYIFQKFSRSNAWKFLKMRQNEYKFCKNISCSHLWKISPNTPKWIKNQTISGSNVWKYLKMRQNGYKFVKNIPRVTCQNTSKCTKTDIHFSKFSGGVTPGPPAGVRTQTQFKRTPLTKPWVRAWICMPADTDCLVYSWVY